MVNYRNVVAAVVAAALVLGIVIACISSERIAPEGSTIDLIATPAQIVLVSGVQAAPVTLLATVRNSIGVPLLGQDVRFSTSSGILSPEAGTPVETNDNGNAISILTGATQGPTITATSGATSDSLTMTAATGELATITLAPGPLNLLTCNDTFALTATALNPDGDPVSGVNIEFFFVSSGDTILTGTFNPNISPSDVNGEVMTTLSIASVDCQGKCSPSKTCTGEIQARNQGRTILSNVVTINDQVP